MILHGQQMTSEKRQVLMQIVLSKAHIHMLQPSCMHDKHTSIWMMMILSLVTCRFSFSYGLSLDRLVYLSCIDL